MPFVDNFLFQSLPYGDKKRYLRHFDQFFQDIRPAISSQLQSANLIDNHKVKFIVGCTLKCPDPLFYAFRKDGKPSNLLFAGDLPEAKKFFRHIGW